MAVHSVLGASCSDYIKMKLNIYSVCHNYLFILLFLLLAISFGRNSPSSGQYLQKLKNAGAYSRQVSPFHRPQRPYSVFDLDTRRG